jgi:hypothetical protein
MTLHKILNSIKEQISIIDVEINKTSKVSRKKSRSAANQIKKLAGEFKKLSSLEENK